MSLNTLIKNCRFKTPQIFDITLLGVYHWCKCILVRVYRTIDNFVVNNN